MDQRSQAADDTTADPDTALTRKIVAAGLSSDDDLRRFMASLSPDVRATGLAAALLNDGRITPFQLEWLANPTKVPLVLGNYVLLRRLGSGGMGDVYQARQGTMRRQVALKVLKPEIAADPASLARFEREVQAAALLEHPNVVRAYDSGVADGIPYLVSEYVAGCDLAELVKIYGPLSPGRAVGLIRQAARGLEYAHQAGVIHRDVKPANFMLSVDGIVKVMDLGLARLGGSDDDSADGLTRTGQVMGTCLYMAPEQAMDTKNADARADVYSLGCTLHYLLSGKPPFQGGTAYAVQYAHNTAPIPSLSGLHPAIGPKLEAVYRKMLAKNREHRHESMTAARIALENCGVPVEAPPDLSAASRSSASASKFRSDRGNAERDSAATASWGAGHGASHESSPANAARRWWGWPALGAFTAVAAACAAAVTFRAEPPTGTIDVEVDQPGVEVLVDGQSRVTIRRPGEAAPITLAADGERHELKLVKDGFSVYAKEFSLKDRDRRTLRVSLVPTPPTVSAPVPVPPVPTAMKEPAPVARSSEAGTHAGEERSDNALGMKLVWCPPGKFLMGSPTADTTALAHEKPQTNVELTNGFWLGKFEVTQGEWKNLMGTEPWKGQNLVKEDANGPATYVSWEDAESFCKKWTQRETASGKLAPGWKYRLPTEAEWEYACRAGSTSYFAFGDDESQLTDYAWYYENVRDVHESYAHAVGRKRGNAWGLHDLHGNAWEWCEDRYGEALTGGRNPTGPSEGTFRVLRGGGWDCGPAYCRSAMRLRKLPTAGNDGIGFRVARVPANSR